MATASCTTCQAPNTGGTPGKRRLNWDFHETDAGKTIPGMTTDEDGCVRRGLRPGAASDDQVAYCRAMARAHFPPCFGDVVEATPQRFVQPVFDICVPTYSNGRMALIGDAATLSRPHIGGGAGKALDDALALSEMLEAGKSLDDVLAEWDQARSAFGAEVFDLGQSLGRHLVEDTPVWEEMDQASMDRWWEDVQRDRFWFWVNEVQDKHPDFKTDDR